MLLHISAALGVVLVLCLSTSVANETVPKEAFLEDPDKFDRAKGPNFSLYNFRIKNTAGDNVEFKQFQGKVCLFFLYTYLAYTQLISH